MAGRRGRTFYLDLLPFDLFPIDLPLLFEVPVATQPTQRPDPTDDDLTPSEREDMAADAEEFDDADGDFDDMDAEAAVAETANAGGAAQPGVSAQPGVAAQPGVSAQPSVSAGELRLENERLHKRIADLEVKNREFQEQTRHYAQVYDKARSEFAAARERITREHERNVRRDQAKVVGGLLSVLDTLDRSLESVKAAPPGQAFVDGVQMIRSQFETALGAAGLKRFDGAGEAFDPERHQAVTSVPVADPAQDNRVVQSLSAGATVGDEVVRPATVVVGKYVRHEVSEDAN